MIYDLLLLKSWDILVSKKTFLGHDVLSSDILFLLRKLIENAISEFLRGVTVYLEILKLACESFIKEIPWLKVLKGVNFHQAKHMLFSKMFKAPFFLAFFQIYLQ